MTYYTDPAKNTFAYNLSVAKEMAAAESFPTKQAKKDCLTRIQRAYECLVKKIDRDALKAIGHDHWNVYPSELRHIREDKHLKLLHAGLGWDRANSVTYLKGYQTQVKEMPVVKPTAKPKAPARTTERQATHVGTCQICGRKHKVDVQSGRIASHGYTKDFGFHSNQCFGSHSMPYETHTDRLEELVAKMEVQKAQALAHKCFDDAEIAQTYIERTEARIAAHNPNQPLTPVEELV